MEKGSGKRFIVDRRLSLRGKRRTKISLLYGIRIKLRREFVGSEETDTGDTTTGILEIVFKAFCNTYFEYDEDISKNEASNANFEIKV